ncbi:MAG: PAS domain-containing protein, partial [Ktedonobacteraceae bacterium]
MLGGPTSPFFWDSSGDSPDAQTLSLWSAYTGQDESAVSNWGWLNALHPTDRAVVREAWQRAAYKPHVFTLTYRVFQKGADYQCYKVLHVPLFTEKHQLHNWLVFFVLAVESSCLVGEHWEQKIINSMLYTQTELLARIQEAHSESLVQLEAIFESITDGIVVCDGNKHII